MCGQGEVWGNGAGDVERIKIERSRSPLTDASSDRLVGEHGLGSVLGGGGAAPEPNTAAAWRAQAEALCSSGLLELFTAVCVCV